jgi:hypothetical protein
MERNVRQLNRINRRTTNDKPPTTNDKVVGQIPIGTHLYFVVNSFWFLVNRY